VVVVGHAPWPRTKNVKIQQQQKKIIFFYAACNSATIVSRQLFLSAVLCFFQKYSKHSAPIGWPSKATSFTAAVPHKAFCVKKIKSVFRFFFSSTTDYFFYTKRFMGHSVSGVLL